MARRILFCIVDATLDYGTHTIFIGQKFNAVAPCMAPFDR